MLPAQGNKNPASHEAGGDAKRRKEAADSDDSSDDGIVDPDIQKILRKARGLDSESEDEGKAKPKKAGKGGESDSDSDSSSSSSSSTTSSSSSVSSIEDEQQLEAISRAGDEEDDEHLSPEDQLKRDFQACKDAVLKRKDLLWLLHQLPQEDAYQAIKRAWVRITLQVGVCVLVQVTDLVDEEPYSVDGGSSSKKASTAKVSLRCRRCMPPERNYKISYVSNQDVTKEEFEQWFKLANHHGMDLEHYRPIWADKARDIAKAREFKFDEKTVSAILRSKTDLGVDLEFDAQKESRMRSEVHSVVTQMTLCGMREARAQELELRENQARSSIGNLVEKAARHQEEWFDKRANLYSLKEINVKNKTRQVARDKHALEFTYVLEAEAEEAERMGKAERNPYERRHCRPVSAWDTKLTTTEGLNSGEKMQEAKATSASSLGQTAAPPASAPVADAERAIAADDVQARKVAPARDMRVHRHLWRMIVSDIHKESPAPTA